MPASSPSENSPIKRLCPIQSMTTERRLDQINRWTICHCVEWSEGNIQVWSTYSSQASGMAWLCHRCHKDAGYITISGACAWPQKEFLFRTISWFSYSRFFIPLSFHGRLSDQIMNHIFGENSAWPLGRIAGIPIRLHCKNPSCSPPRSPLLSSSYAPLFPNQLQSHSFWHSSLLCCWALWASFHSMYFCMVPYS